jgi:hypothetical protein
MKTNLLEGYAQNLSYLSSEGVAKQVAVFPSEKKTEGAGVAPEVGSHQVATANHKNKEQNRWGKKCQLPLTSPNKATKERNKPHQYNLQYSTTLRWPEVNERRSRAQGKKPYCILHCSFTNLISKGKDPFTRNNIMNKPEEQPRMNDPAAGSDIAGSVLVVGGNGNDVSGLEYLYKGVIEDLSRHGFDEMAADLRKIWQRGNLDTQASKTTEDAIKSLEGVTIVDKNNSAAELHAPSEAKLSGSYNVEGVATLEAAKTPATAPSASDTAKAQSLAAPRQYQMSEGTAVTQSNFAPATTTLVRNDGAGGVSFPGAYSVSSPFQAPQQQHQEQPKANPPLIDQTFCAPPSVNSDSMAFHGQPRPHPGGTGHLPSARRKRNRLAHAAGRAARARCHLNRINCG